MNFNFKHTLSFICFFFLLVFFSGCYQLNIKPIDEKNVRNQLHLPVDVKLVKLESSPKTPGWFGREGLRIYAVFQFNDKQFNEYVQKINNQQGWDPEAYIDYSPNKADSYSDLSMKWLNWPINWDYTLPMNTQEFERYPDMNLYESLKEQKGKYYCSVISTVATKKIPHQDGTFHYEWENMGLHCSELAVYDPQKDTPPTVPAWATIKTSAVILFESKQLHAVIQFSG